MSMGSAKAATAMAAKSQVETARRLGRAAAARQRLGSRLVSARRRDSPLNQV